MNTWDMMCVAILHSYLVCWSRYLECVIKTESVDHRQAHQIAAEHPPPGFTGSSSSSLFYPPSFFATKNEDPYKFRLSNIVFPVSHPEFYFIHYMGEFVPHLFYKININKLLLYSLVMITSY